jgi:spore germination protein YaaH
MAVAWGGPPVPEVGPHARDAARFSAEPTHPTLVATQAGATEFTDRTSGPCRTVFGYFPYWQSAANIQWDTLTHIACFSIEFRGDGTISTTRGWPWTGVINSANANGVKIVLVATLFDPAQLLTLLQSPTNRQRFITNLRTQMLAGSAKGVNIDFEGSGSNGWPSLLPQFITELRAGLEPSIPGVEITLATPAVNWNGAWPLNTLAQLSDGLMMMGYDYFGSWSTTSGPSGPLTNPTTSTLSVTTSLNNDYAAIVAQRPEKLILGVPYYGNQWRTNGQTPYSTARSYVGSVFYSSAAAGVTTHGRQWDPTSQTPWYRWNAATFPTQDWNQVWFDDAQSLGLKYDTAKARNLAGIGIWALGYDGTRTELWNLLRQEFVTECPCPADFDGSGFADSDDFIAFVAAFSAGLISADFDGSGFVDSDDFIAYAGVFAQGC